MRTFSLVCGMCAAIVLTGLCSLSGAQSLEQQGTGTDTAPPPAEQAPPPDQQVLSAPQEAHEAAPAQTATTPAALLDTSGRTKLSVNGVYGVGFSSVDVGVTTYGDDVSISGGGGLGFAGQFGYGLSSRFDVDIDLGVQVSVLDPPVDNAEGTFARSYVQATLKYKVPTSDTGQFKFGLGAGSYVGGELDIDTSRVPGGAHTIVSYKPAVGFHATGEFERFVRPDLSFHLGAKVSVVTYDADEVTIDGVSVPLAFLRGDVREFDGSGFDVMIGISKYF